MNAEDTIAAICCPPGGAFRGIVRLSGSTALDCIERCWRGDPPIGGEAVVAATVRHGALMAPPPVGPIPCDAYLWPGARSYTRQPVVEIHTIGSPPLLETALQTVCAAGARLAEPGEFTLRAFLAGRIDLTQAEAVLGVIDAHDRNELELALEQLAGGLGGPLADLRDRLADLLAHLEAGLDFAEEPIEFIAHEQLVAGLAAATARFPERADRLQRRGHDPGAFRVVLVGWPNVGKSSLLNALAGETAAIVSESAGTTRDYLERPIRVHGLDCLLIDTAGLQADCPSDIAALAQAAAARQADRAHVQLFCVDATRRLNAWERDALEGPAPPHRLLILTKCDAARATDLHAPAIATSSKTGQGLSALRRALAQTLMDQLPHEPDVVAATAVRCRESVRLAAQSVQRARQAAAQRAGEELVAAEIRFALDELGKVVGAVYTDDILDRIFGRFCIGK